MSVPHNRLTFGSEEARAAAEVVSSGQWAAGAKVAELEERLAARAGVAAAVCVGSGVAALRLSLAALGVGSGSRVAVPAYSCVALANATLALDALPVAVDVDPGSWNIASDGADANAVVAVHTFGVRAPIAELRARGFPVVEDCAHAFGLPGLGSAGDASILSFYATKLIGAGEGGAVLTDRQDVAAFVRERRDYTDAPPDGKRLNDKLTDLEAALALCQLERLDETIRRRAELAARYEALLEPALGAIALPVGGDRVWYRYAVELLQHSPAEAIERLERLGIHAAEPVWDWRPANDRESPNATRAYASLLSLPLYPTLTDVEQEAVARAVIDCLV